MKKKMFLLIALLVAVTLTSYSVSGTYAKYVSKITDTDEARVAKWGFTGDESITVDLFKDSYSHVKNGGGTKIIAPGTSGSYAFKLDSTTFPQDLAEVDYEIDVEATITDKIGRLVYWLDDDATYDLATNKITKTGTTYTSSDLDSLKTAISNKMKVQVLTTDENVKNTIEAKTTTLHWAWVYDDESNSGSKDEDDMEKAKTENYNNSTVSMTVNVTAKQIKPEA